MSRARHAILAARARAWPRPAILLIALPLMALAAEATTVMQRDRAFAVAAISIMRGQTVRFSNEDNFTHQIFVETPQFTYESDEQEPGASIAVAFPATGHFTVRCHIHPRMHLDVDVQ